MQELFKVPCFIFYCSVFSQGLFLPKKQHNMITIVTSVNTTSQSTLDTVSSNMSSRSLLQYDDTWLVYNLHELDFSFELDDLEDDKLRFNIFTKYFRFITKFTKERNQVFMLYTATYEETLTAIQNSGFGTSSSAVFMVMITNGFQNTSEHLTPFDEGLNEIDKERDPFNAVLVFIEAHALKQTKVGIMCHTCLGSKIRYFQTNMSETFFDFLKNLSNQLNQNGNGRKVLLRGASESLDTVSEISLKSMDAPVSRALMHHILSDYNLEGICLPILRRLNVSMIVPSSLKTLKERQKSRWWFNIAMEEQNIIKVTNQVVKSRERYLLGNDMPLKTFVCLDSQDLRTFGLLFFSVINPTIWILIFTVAFLLCFIHKSLKQGVDFVLAVAAIPVHSQQRKHVVYFIFWANFVAQIWQSNLSADVLGIQKIPDFSILIENNWRTWLHKKYVSGGIKGAFSMLGPKFWHGKTTDEIIYDESLDPIPWNDTLALVEKLKRKKLTVFMFLERSFSSQIWKKAHFVSSHTICKTILFHSDKPRGLQGVTRIWGLEYAQNIFERWSEAGSLIHLKNIQLRGSRLFKGIPLRQVQGFSLPDPLPIKSAVGFCLLGIFSYQLFLFLVGLVVHRRSVKSWIMHIYQVTGVKLTNLNQNFVKTGWGILDGTKLLIKLYYSRFTANFNAKTN